MLERATDYLRIFVSPVELIRYLRMRDAYMSGQRSSAPALFRVRAIGDRPLLCRMSQDVWTLRDTFVNRYHLPPEPLPEHATIVDLGANVGYTVAHLAHLYPTARIVGVELDRENYELATRNTAAFGARVVIVHAGVWIEDGVVTYDGARDDAFAISPGATDAATSGGTHTAPALRLDALFERYDIARVDYLKMDIEGAEAAILAAPLDWADRVRAIKIEVHAPATVAWCCERLTSAGFTCARDTVHPEGVVAVRHAEAA